MQVEHLGCPPSHFDCSWSVFSFLSSKTYITFLLRQAAQVVFLCLLTPDLAVGTGPESAMESFVELHGPLEKIVE